MPIYAILQAGKSRYGGQPIWYGNTQHPMPFTISNLAANGNIWIGNDQAVGPSHVNYSTPIAPGSYLSFDGAQPVYYVIADGPGVTALIIPGVVSVFQPGGITIGPSPPSTPIAEDASTPAVVHVVQTLGPVGTTAGFSPPANSLLVAILNLSSNNSGAVFTAAVSDSGGHTWTQRINISDPSGTVDYASIWTAPITTAPGSITVTGKNNDATVNTSLQLSVRVVDNTNANQSTAAKASTSGTSLNLVGNLITTKVGSLVYIAMGSLANGSAPAISGTTTIDDFEDSASIYSGKSTALTTITGSTSFGWTGGNSEGFAWAALEIVP